MIDEDLNDYPEDYAEEYYNTPWRNGGLLDAYAGTPQMSVLELMRAYERLGFNCVGILEPFYATNRPPVLKAIKTASSTPQYFYREATPTQSALYFPETRRTPSPEPLSEVCCGKKDSLLSLLIRCFVPCLSPKNDA